MTVKSKGITKFIIAKDAQLLPAPDVPPDFLKRQHVPDPLKKCVLNLLSQGGRSQGEAEAWCTDFLNMGGETNEAAASDSANIREAERLLIQVRDDIMKPTELERCIENRQNLFGEGSFTAAKNCRRDWGLSERIHGTEEQDLQHGPIGTDVESRLTILDAPATFTQLAILRIRLDARIEELMCTSNMLDSESGAAPRKYTFKEADRKARGELGLPQVSRMQPDVATVPDVTGKTKEQLIKESVAADTERRPNERRISPHSGVPEMYGKTKEQILKEHAEEDAGDRRSQ